MTPHIDRVDGVDAAVEQLDALAAQAVGPFQTSAWLRAWAAAWEPEVVVSVLTAARHGAVVGALPVAWMNRRAHPRLPVPIRYLGIAGSTGGADHLGPITADPEAAVALVDAMRALAGHRPVLLEHVAPASATPLLGGLGRRAQVVRSHPCPTLDLVSDPESRWSAKLRKSVRRRGRMLGDEGWTTRWVEDGPELLDGLEHLRARHLDRWGDRVLAGSFDGRRDRLLRELVTGWRGDGGPVLQLLEHPDGRVGAAQLILRCRTSWCVYKTGWDPQLASLGPGVHLAVEAVRAARSAGADELDFLRGTSAYKYALGAVDRYDQSIVLTDSIAGRLLALRERASERRTTPTAPEASSASRSS